MSTVEDVARHLAGLTATEEDILLIGTWVDARWKEVAATRVTLRQLYRESELYIPAPYNTGTVDVTNGSTTVTGTSTAWTSDLGNRHIRFKTAWYKIGHVVSATSLELATPYAEETATGLGYNMVLRWHRLATGVRKLGVFSHMRLGRPLHVVHKQGLDLVIPRKHSINSVPTWVAEIDPDVDGVKRVEIYPYSSQAEIIHYSSWIKPYTLSFKDQLPEFLDIEALREGVMIDVLRHKMHKAIMANQPEAAALYRNEYRAQETIWNRLHKDRVLGQEQGTDDQEFILTHDSGHPSVSEDRIIDDAWSEVWYGRT
jgi:hypothetical protein